MDADTPEACIVSEGLPDSITKISQAVKEEDSKLMRNEALVKYTKLEIEKLQGATKELNDNHRKLQAENVLLQKQSLELDISIDEGRKSLDIKADMLVTLQQEKDCMESESRVQASRCETVYNKYLEEYKDIRKEFETYHPLYKQVKQLQTDNLKVEVQFKMLEAKTIEMKKQLKLRREIDKKMFYAKIVNFAKGVLAYWEARKLSQQLAEAQEEQTRLFKEQQEMELLVANMNLEQGKQLEAPKEPLKQTNAEFKTYNYEDMLKNSNRDTSAMPPPSVFKYPSSLTENPDSREERKLELRAKWKQRQQQWEQQHLAAGLNRKPNLFARNVKQPLFLGQTPISSHKRPLISMGAPTPPFKHPKLNPTPNVPNLSAVNQQTKDRPTAILRNPEIPAFIGQTAKAKILSVHTLSNASQAASNQHLHQPSVVHQPSPMLREAKKNPEMAQRAPQHFLKASQNYQPESNIPQTQFQERGRNMSVPPSGISVNVPSKHLLSGEISQTASQLHSIVPDYLSQMSMQSSQNVATYSLPVVSQKGNSQTVDDLARPHLSAMTAETQPDVTSGLPCTTFSYGTQPPSTPATYKSTGNSTGTGTSSTSTYSQKLMEQQLQQILQKQPPDMAFNLPSLPQMKINTPAEIITTSPFFNKPKEGEIIGHNENISIQGPIKNAFGNPSQISQYLDNPALLTNQEEESNMSFTGEYPNLFTPEYDQNLEENTENPTQSGAFNFNFGHPEAPQPNQMKFLFSTNPTPSSNPFNMF